MNKQNQYTEDGGSNSSKKKKNKNKNANLTDEGIHNKASKRALKKTHKALDSVGTEDYVEGSASPEAYSKNYNKTVKRLKKKRAGTGNHPMSK